MTHNLHKTILGSSVVHVSILLLMIYLPKSWMSAKLLPWQREDVTWVSLPKGGDDAFGTRLKKVDRLPRSTVQEKKQPPTTAPEAKDAKKVVPLDTPKAPEKVGPKTTPTPTVAPKSPTAKPKPKPNKLDDDIAKALAGVAGKVEKTKPIESAQVPDLGQGGYTFGNTDNPGLLPTDPAYIAYQMQIRKAIFTQWIVPQKFLEENYQLICRLVVRINDRGEVVDTKWETPSGTDSFDQSALRAVQRASPLPIPPEKLKAEALMDGFLIEFSPKQAQ